MELLFTPEDDAVAFASLTVTGDATLDEDDEGCQVPILTDKGYTRAFRILKNLSAEDRMLVLCYMAENIIFGGEE